MGNNIKSKPFLRGTRVLLRELLETDVDGAYPLWFNQEEVCRWNSHHVFPYTKNSALEYIRYAGSTKESLILAIVASDEGCHIGNVALQAIHPVYHSAELSIILGDQAYWGKGFAIEACRLICRHGFDALNLNRISCGTFAPNAGMRNLALALGMREEGVRRQAAYKNGHFIDVVEFGMLRNELRDGGSKS